MDMMKIMKQAGKLKKAQKKINNEIIVNETGGAKITMTGGGELKNFLISDDLYRQGKEAVESSVKEAVAGVLKKQQELQKSMAKEALGGMSLPGM